MEESLAVQMSKLKTVREKAVFLAKNPWVERHTVGGEAGFLFLDDSFITRDGRVFEEGCGFIIFAFE
jgi:hypothetical protein